MRQCRVKRGLRSHLGQLHAQRSGGLAMSMREERHKATRRTAPIAHRTRLDRVILIRQSHRYLVDAMQ